MQLSNLVLAASVLASSAAAQPPPIHSASQLPIAVRRYIVELNTLCSESGGKPGKSSQLVKYADLTGDGLGDYVIDVNGYECEGAAGAMVNGQSGAGLAVFVAGPANTAAKAYVNSVYGSKIDRTGGKARLYIDVAAASCGQRNADRAPFSDWKFCSRPVDWDPVGKVFRFAPLSQARPTS